MPGQHLDDLSRIGAAVDLANSSGGRAIELVNDAYGDGTAERLAASGAPRTVGMLANEIDRSARQLALEQFERSRGGQRRSEGDVLGLAASYARVGSAGHPAELANQPGRDSREIELARFEGRYAHICGQADAYGRCASQLHEAGCSHVAEAGASYGATPEDSAGWRAALSRRGSQPFADADGRGWRNGRGDLASLGDHVEAMTGQRHGESPFYGDRSKRRELASVQPERVLADPSADPGSAEAYREDVPHSALATARALAAQAGLATAADAARHREAQRAEVERVKAVRAVTTSGRRHPDYGESMRDRRERLHQDVRLSNAAEPGDDLLGALPTYVAGQL